MGALLSLLADDAAGVSSGVALLWGGIATAAGGTMTTVIAKLWYRQAEKDKDHATEMATQRTLHEAALAAERKRTEDLRIECAGELRALHATNLATVERFSAAMEEAREEFCPACRDEPKPNKGRARGGDRERT